MRKSHKKSHAKRGRPAHKKARVTAFKAPAVKRRRPPAKRRSAITKLKRHGVYTTSGVPSSSGMLAKTKSALTKARSSAKEQPKAALVYGVTTVAATAVAMHVLEKQRRDKPGKFIGKNASAIEYVLGASGAVAAFYGARKNKIEYVAGGLAAFALVAGAKQQQMMDEKHGLAPAKQTQGAETAAASMAEAIRAGSPGLIQGTDGLEDHCLAAVRDIDRRHQTGAIPLPFVNALQSMLSPFAMKSPAQAAKEGAVSGAEGAMDALLVAEGYSPTEVGLFDRARKERMLRRLRNIEERERRKERRQLAKAIRKGDPDALAYIQQQQQPSYDAAYGDVPIIQPDPSYSDAEY